MGWRDNLRGRGEGSESVYRDAQTNYTNSPRRGKGEGDRNMEYQMKIAHTSSPRRGLTEVLTHAVPKMLVSEILREYSVPACSPMM